MSHGQNVVWYVSNSSYSSHSASHHKRKQMFDKPTTPRGRQQISEQQKHTHDLLQRGKKALTEHHCPVVQMVLVKRAVVYTVSILIKHNLFCFEQLIKYQYITQHWRIYLHTDFLHTKRENEIQTQVVTAVTQGCIIWRRRWWKWKQTYGKLTTCDQIIWNVC